MIGELMDFLWKNKWYIFGPMLAVLLIFSALLYFTKDVELPHDDTIACCMG